MTHRIWKEPKQEPGTAGPGNMLGCCLNSFHFLWAILSMSTLYTNHVVTWSSAIRTPFLVAMVSTLSSYKDHSPGRLAARASSAPAASLGRHDIVSADRDRRRNSAPREAACSRVTATTN